jgi:hypothetical protein
LQIHQIDHENPLLGKSENEFHDSEIWFKGNFVLLNLNLSRKNIFQKIQ